MSQEFKIYQIGDSQIIERLTYPRFTGIIKNSVESDIDIENIEIDENILHAEDITNALREAEEFIINHSS